MRTTRTLGVLALVILLFGCAHERHSASSDAQSWPRFLSEDETARCKQVAWEAAESREMWERFKPKRLTTEPVKLNASFIQYYLDQEQFDKVEVAIPSRGTYEVLSMRESFWP
jgi:hypothetical protein